MESYQKAKMPPPVPPKYHKLTLNAMASSYQKENVFRNGGGGGGGGHHQLPITSSGGGAALIQTNGMRVKIQINPENPVCGNDYRTVLGSTRTSQSNGNNVKINVNGGGCCGTGTENRRRRADDMLLKSSSSSCANCNTNNDYTSSSSSSSSITSKKNIINAFNGVGDHHPKSNSSSKYINVSGTINHNSSTNGYLCYIPSGQSSPSDNLDSGTCSDVDVGARTPPPPFSFRKKSHSKSATPTSLHQRSASLNSSGIGGDSDEDGGGRTDDEDDASCDSVNSSELNGENECRTLPIISAAILKCSAEGRLVKNRNGESPLSSPSPPVFYGDAKLAADVPERRKYATGKSDDMGVDEKTERTNDTDRFLHFHLNENNFDDAVTRQAMVDDDTFAGLKSVMEKNTPAATIRSAKGTVRGVKNRVRAGIATFLSNNLTKTWQDKEAGKVVVYTTTMGIVRGTYHRCLKVRQILRTHLVKFEEKDVFMSRELQKEIRERMNTEEIVVPQVFVEGIHIGDAETIDRLNESGELRQILKPYKSADALNTCQVCGGYRLLPCNMCNGSKKSTYRNHFSTELVTLKCMNCDEVGLVKCYAC